MADDSGGSLVKVNIDLKDAPKEVRKMVESFERFGLHFIPGQVRKLAQAKADAVVIRAKGTADAALIRTQSESDQAIIRADAAHELMDRIVTRLRARELRRQPNLEAIRDRAIELAQEQAASGTRGPVSDEPVSDEVMCAIIDNCQDVSDTQMQEYWAKLIRGEFAKPGSFSPKTMSVLNTLRKEDAELFTKLCSFAWGFPNEAHKFTPHTPAGGPPLGEFIDPQYLSLAAKTHDFVEAEVPYFRRVELESLGLIKMSPSASQGVFKTITKAEPLDLHYFGTCHTIRWTGSSPPFMRVQFAADYFTPAGNAIIRFAGATE